MCRSSNLKVCISDLILGGKIDIVWFQKISIPTPRKVIGNSAGVRGGSQMPKFLKESMKLKWNFQRGGGAQTKKTLLWQGANAN